MRSATAVVLAALTVGGGMFVTAGAASGSSLPKAQSLEWGGWHRGWQVRPGSIGLGSYFALRGLRYSYWSSSSASGKGQLLISNCRPDCAKAAHWTKASVYFHGVRSHSGPGRYFRDLRITYGRNHHTLYLHITSGGRGYYY